MNTTTKTIVGDIKKNKKKKTLVHKKPLPFSIKLERKTKKIKNKKKI